MPKKEVPIEQLQDYLPPGTYDAVLSYLRQYKVHLTVARERKSILVITVTAPIIPIIVSVSMAILIVFFSYYLIA